MSTLYAGGLLYTPSTSYRPHTSPLHSLSLSEPKRIRGFSLVSGAGG